MEHFSAFGSIPDVKYQPWKLRHAQRAANLFQRNYSISTPGPSSLRTPISANLGLNFNQGFFFLLSKTLFRIIFSIFLEYPIIKLKAKRIKLNLLFKLSYLSSNFALTLGYLNPASNNSAQSSSSYDDRGGRGVRTGVDINVYRCPKIVTLTNFILLRRIYFSLFFQESIFFLFKWGSQGENKSGTLMFCFGNGERQLRCMEPRVLWSLEEKSPKTHLARLKLFLNFD